MEYKFHLNIKSIKEFLYNHIKGLFDVEMNSLNCFYETKGDHQYELSRLPVTIKDEGNRINVYSSSPKLGNYSEFDMESFLNNKIVINIMLGEPINYNGKKYNVEITGEIKTQILDNGYYANSFKNDISMFLINENESYVKISYVPVSQVFMNIIEQERNLDFSDKNGVYMLSVQHKHMKNEKRYRNDGLSDISYIVDEYYNILDFKYEDSIMVCEWFEQNDVSFNILGDIVNDDDLMAFKLKYM